MLAKGMMALWLLLPLQNKLAWPVNGTGKTFPGGMSDKDVAQLIYALPRGKQQLHIRIVR